jgi:tetratricopeptide (TPR) repeat protein
MQRLVGGVAFLVALMVALPARGATPSEFYLGMLQRGVTAYDAGRYDAAVGPLRIAAFGLVDSVPHYQTAQVYLALTHDRLANVEPAREAARRVVVAERVESRYASLQIPAAAKTTFEGLARKVLAPIDFAVLANARPNATPNPPRANTAPATITPTPAASTPAPARNTPAPAATTTTTTTTTVRTEPAPVKADPPAPKPQPPAASTTTATTPNNTTTAKPAPTRPAPSTSTAGTTTTTPSRPAQTTTTAPAQTRPPVNVSAQFTAAEQALATARLADARSIYRELLDVTTLQRADLLRLAEGFYRSRDFANALRAFDRLGALRRGEEPYRYYIAVALYESGQYTRAKQELAVVLPYIEVTPDVARYRTKIEGAVNQN